MCAYDTNHGNGLAGMQRVNSGQTPRKQRGWEANVSMGVVHAEPGSVVERSRFMQVELQVELQEMDAATHAYSAASTRCSGFTAE